MLGMDVAYVSEIVGDDMLDGRITKVTSWNTGAERIFGYSASEAIGHDIIDLIGLPGSEEKMQRSLEAAGAGEVLHREGRRRRSGLIERANPLHDVGKVAIPDNVLLKAGPVTPAERSVIETHAEIGHRLLAGSDSAVLQMAATIALTHHEHYDGRGYPGGLGDEAIPIEGRIFAIADVFDALTSDRVYRSAMTHEQALAILRAGPGTHFDPGLLDHFIDDLATPALRPSPPG